MTSMTNVTISQSRNDNSRAQQCTLFENEIDLK